MSALPHLCEMLLQLLVSLGEIGHTNGFVVLAFGNDAVIECDTGRAVMQFPNFKAGGRRVGDIKPFAFAARRKEDVIVEIGVNGLREGRFENDAGRAIGELGRAVILEPVLGSLDGVKRDFTLAAIDRHKGGLAARTIEVARNINAAVPCVALGIEGPSLVSRGRVVKRHQWRVVRGVILEIARDRSSGFYV